MSLRRVVRLAAMVLPTLLCVSCGQVYRPVVIPLTPTPPVGANFHAVFSISANVPNFPGGAMQIDVSGDTILAETPSSDPSAPNVGVNPTHGAILSNDSRVFVAAAGSVSGLTDSVASFTPDVQFSAASGFGAVTAISLPAPSASITSISESGNVVTATLSAALNVAAGYAISISGVATPGCTPPTCAHNGTFTLLTVTGSTIQYTNPVSGLTSGASGTALVPPQPVFLNSVETTAMYVANYNANSVFAINTSVNVVGNTAIVGVNPVSLAESKTANGFKLYVANQGTSQAGTSSISSLNTVDLSPNNVTGFTGTNPVWAVARADGQKVYVVTQGDGKLVTVDTATDVASTPDCTVTPTLCVGAGANYIFYDPNLNRLYVTNPVTSMVYVFSDVSDIPVQLAAISLGSSFSACSVGAAGCSAVWPVSVTALADGSRFYVATYQTATSCPDALAGTSSECVIPGVSVFNANNFTPQYSSGSTLQLLTDPPFAATADGSAYQYAVPLLAACGPVTPPVAATLYTPGSTRFRVFTAASADATRVYVGMCDAGAIAVINTTDNNPNNAGNTTPPDTLVTDLPAAFSAGAIQSNGEPPNQNPIFLFPGQ